MSMSERFESVEHFSLVIDQISSKIPEEGIKLEYFLDIIGERGLRYMVYNLHDDNCSYTVSKS